MGTYIPIATIVVGSGGANTIEFTSIPGTYSDLLLKLSARSNRNVFLATSLNLRFNGSTANYYNMNLTKQSTSASESVTSNANESELGWNSQDTDTANTFGVSQIYIPNYTSSNNKTFSADTVQENNSTSQYMSISSGRWENSAAITSITLRQLNGSFNFKQYSTATLYGIKNS